MNFDFEKALQAGYDKKEIFDFLESKDTDIDFKAFRQNYNNDYPLMFEELKKGNKTGEISEFNKARLWLNEEDRAKLNEADFYKAKENLAKNEYLKELENQSTLDKALSSVGYPQ